MRVALNFNTTNPGSPDRTREEAATVPSTPSKRLAFEVEDGSSPLPLSRERVTPRTPVNSPRLLSAASTVDRLSSQLLSPGESPFAASRERYDASRTQLVNLQTRGDLFDLRIGLALNSIDEEEKFHPGLPLTEEQMQDLREQGVLVESLQIKAREVCCFTPQRPTRGSPPLYAQEILDKSQCVENGSEPSVGEVEMLHQWRGDFFQLYRCINQPRRIVKLFTPQRRSKQPKKMVDYLENGFAQYQRFKALGLPVVAIYNHPVREGFYLQERVPFLMSPEKLWPVGRSWEELSTAQQTLLEQVKKVLHFAALEKEICDFTANNFGVNDSGELVLLDFMEEQPEDERTIYFRRSLESWSVNADPRVASYLLEGLPEEGGIEKGDLL